MRATDLHGMSSPVLAPAEPAWRRDYAGVTTDHLLALTDQQLAAVDPLAMNLIVAREIPSLARLDLNEYQDTVNRWALEFATNCLPNWQFAFHNDPDRYFGDARFFSVAMLCHYLFENVGISYIEEQRDQRPRHYTNPSDLFLNGLIDSLRGTCGNMPALALAMGWRIGWPVSLACARDHFLLRYDDGDVTFNMEVATTLAYGYWSPTDEEIIDEKRLPPAALACGSDLRALTPRERLSVFVGLRARHYKNLAEIERNRDWLRLAERDYLLARWLFPAHRGHHTVLAHLSACLSEERFDSCEGGHWRSYGRLMVEVDEYLQGSHPSLQPDHRSPAHPEAMDRVLAESENLLSI